MAFLDLFRPKWKHSDWRVRKEAYEKLGNEQAALAEVAKNDNDWKVRNAAVIKLTDQAILIKIALYDESVYVRAAAVENLTDQFILTDFAKNDKKWEVRKAAFEKLGNRQEALYEVINNDTRLDDRLEAAKSLIKIANENPMVLLSDWEKIGNLITEPHQDSHKDVHADNSHDCSVHTDYTNSTGIGLKFPPYPSHLKNKK